MQTESRAQPGESYLLFDHLPFDYASRLPLPIGSTTDVVRPPFELLDTFDAGEACFLLPQYGLPTEINHCCLRAGRGLRGYEEVQAALFGALVRLRLVVPIPYRVEGQFTLGEDLKPTGVFALYHVSAPSVGHPKARFTATHLTQCRAIEEPLRLWEAVGVRRLLAAFALFSQISSGLVQSRQLAFVGLFSVLEAVFCPQGSNKARQLALSTARFLTDVPQSGSLGSAGIGPFVEELYTRVRSKIAHTGFSPLGSGHGDGGHAARGESFCTLYEVVRGVVCKLIVSDLEVLSVLYASDRSIRNGLDRLLNLTCPEFGFEAIHLQPIPPDGGLPE